MNTIIAVITTELWHGGAGGYHIRAHGAGDLGSQGMRMSLLLCTLCVVLVLDAWLLAPALATHDNLWQMLPCFPPPYLTNSIPVHMVLSGKVDTTRLPV